MVELSVVSSRAVLSAVLIPIFAHSCDSYVVHLLLLLL